MFKSVCAEYEIRKWHEPTCSGSKYLIVKHRVSKIRNTTHYSKCTELNEEEEKMVGMGEHMDSTCLGILLPSKAFLAEDAVSASLN